MSKLDQYINFLAAEVADTTKKCEKERKREPLSESVDLARTCTEGDYAKVELLLMNCVAV